MSEGQYVVTTKGKLVTEEEAQDISQFVLDACGTDSKPLKVMKVKACLQYIQNARLHKQGMWRVRMMLKGKMPEFIVKKKVGRKSEITLDWSHIKDNKV